MFGNMKEMMKQAQNMKSEMTKIKKELEKVEVEGSSSNGSCVVTMTADMKTTRVEIQETLLSSDAYIIENAIKVAVNNALEKAKDTSAKRLKSVTGGLMDNIPGM
jgi:DNA-binding YbaB/EbfC family protein|tara:strand:+ start:369 stop:683 length:315 start_codon:yes stop_codon:yes gene_type:complete